MAEFAIFDNVHDARNRESQLVPILVKEIPIEEIVIRQNIRKRYGGIDELKVSIRQYGLLQPVTVYKYGERYSVKIGHRRFLAYREIHEEIAEYLPNSLRLFSLNPQTQVILLDRNSSLSTFYYRRRLL